MTATAERWIWTGLGVTYLVGLVLLSDLLGSSADSTAAYTEHFASASARTGDIAGSLLLFVAAILVVVCTVLPPGARRPPNSRYLLLMPVSVVAATMLAVSSALLLTAPLMKSFGDIFGDPGLDPVGAAAVAQAGTATFVLAALALGFWTVLISLGTRRSEIVTAWCVAALTLAAISVVAAFPIGLWWLIRPWVFRPEHR